MRAAHVGAITLPSSAPFLQGFVLHVAERPGISTMSSLAGP